MFDIKFTKEVIYLPSLLADRWKNVAEFKKAKNVQDVVNIINGVKDKLNCYVNLHDLNFFLPLPSSNYYFTRELLKETGLKINNFEFMPYKKNDENNTNIVDFFKVPIKISLLSIEGIRTPKDTTTNLDSIYFMLNDVKNFEEEHNLLVTDNNTNSQEPKETTKKVEVKETEKPQPYLDKEHPNYSSELAMCIELWKDLYINKYGNQSQGVKNRIKSWLTEKNNKAPTDAYLNKISSIVNYDKNPHKTKKIK